MKILVATLAALLLQAPSSSQDATGSIEGSVLGAGGQPVANARVELISWPPPLVYSPGTLPNTTTDATGRFRIENLAPLGYRITVTVAGYIPQVYGAAAGRTADPGTVVTVASGQHVEGITVALSPGGVVSGRVTSIRGEPLVRTSIWAAQRVFDANGSSSLRPAGFAETNDRGEYRVADLAPGRYIIRAAPQPVVFVAIETQRAADENLAAPVLPSPGSFATAFYPGTTDLSRAAPVEVLRGGETRAINIAVPNQSTYRILGRITDTSGEPVPRVGPSILPTPWTLSRESQPYDRSSGTFEKRDIPPGVYWLRVVPAVPVAAAEQERQNRLLGIPRPILPRGGTLVRVVDTDVANVEVKMFRDLTLQGRIRVEGGTPVSPGVKVELPSADIEGARGIGISPTAVDPEGNFVFRDISPWQYRVAASGLPPELYIKEARLGNADVLVEPFQITEPPSASLEILLARGGEVAGTLRNDSAAPVAGKQVVLIPQGVSNRPTLYKTATTDANGRFTIQGIAPGDYRVFSWQSLEPYRYFDADFVREFEDRGTSVRITESSGATIDVKLIP